MIKKIFVTGSNGFIGKNLIKKLKKKHIVFSKSSKDLSKKRNKFPKVDYVVHLAATVKPSDKFKNPLEVIANNFNSTLNLINFYKGQKKKPIFIFASTAHVTNNIVNYEKITKPINENLPILFYNETESTESYALSKFMCEKAIHLSKLNYVILRIFNTYGKDQKDNFFTNIIDQISKENKIVLENPNAKITWLHVEDLTDAILKIISNKKSTNEIFNIGGNQVFTLHQITNKILLKLNSKKKIKKKQIIKNKLFVRDKIPDLKKIKKIINWKPKFNLNDGLDEILKIKDKN